MWIYYMQNKPLRLKVCNLKAVQLRQSSSEDVILIVLVSVSFDHASYLPARATLQIGGSGGIISFTESQVPSTTTQHNHRSPSADGFCRYCRTPYLSPRISIRLSHCWSLQQVCQHLSYEKPNCWLSLSTSSRTTYLNMVYRKLYTQTKVASSSPD